MANLPSDPAIDTDLSSGLLGGLQDQNQDPDEAAHEVASELVLVSVVMVCSKEDEERERKQVKAQRPDEGEGENHDGDMPPLDYTALSRSLVMRTANVLGIQESFVEQAEKAIAQFLFFEMQNKEQAKERKEKEKEGKVNHAVINRLELLRCPTAFCSGLG